MDAFEPNLNPNSKLESTGYISSSEKFPILSITDVKNLFKQGQIHIDEGEHIDGVTRRFRFKYPLWTISNGSFKLNEEQFKREECPIIDVKEFPKGSLEYILQNQQFENPNTVVRLIKKGVDKFELIIIKDIKNFLGDFLSRMFPIVGSEENRKYVVENGLSIQKNPNILYNTIYDDEAFRNIRRTVCIVIGSGTVGTAICEVLSILGVSNIALFEPRNSIWDTSNSSRIPFGGTYSNGKPKWETTMEMIINYNPIAQVRYFGEYSANSNAKNMEAFKNWLADITDRESSSDKPILVFPALDNIELRMHAYQEFIGLMRVAYTDLGLGSLQQVLEPGDSGIPSVQANSMQEAVIEMLGGWEYAVNDYDTNTIEAFMLLSKGIYGFLPQSPMAAKMTQVLLGIFMVMYAKGELIPDRVFADLLSSFQSAETLDEGRKRKASILVNTQTSTQATSNSVEN